MLSRGSLRESDAQPPVIWAGGAKVRQQGSAITSIYHRGMLKAYTTHPIPTSFPNCQPDSVMTQINTFAPANDALCFRKRATAHRNLQDWAKDQRAPNFIDTKAPSSDDRFTGLTNLFGYEAKRNTDAATSTRMCNSMKSSLPTGFGMIEIFSLSCEL